MVNKIVKKPVITAQKPCYQETEKDISPRLLIMHRGDTLAGVISHGMFSVCFVMIMCIGRSHDFSRKGNFDGWGS